jgi:predicted O-linked N-acetylglucosamine transferase (SPINDLY family)
MDSADSPQTSWQHAADVPEWLAQAAALHHAGNMPEAERAYLQVLAAAPDHFDARHRLGILRHQQGRHAEAVALIGAALRTDPDHAEAHYNLGIVLMAMRNAKEAIASYERAIAIAPDYVEAWYNRANVLFWLRRTDAAVASYDKVVALKPDHAPAHANRGSALASLKRFEEALASYDEAAALDRANPSTELNRGKVLLELGRLEEAVAGYDRAIALAPDYGKAHHQRGHALMRLGQLEPALASYDRAAALDPRNAEIHSSRGTVLLTLGRAEEALASYERAVALRPDDGGAHHDRGNALMQLERLSEALASYERATTLAPRHKYAFGALASCALRLCDWSRTARFADPVRNLAVGNAAIIPPIVLLGYCGDPSVQLQCARNFTRDAVGPTPKPLWDGAVWRNERIRIAYVSGDFRRHPVGHLIVELLERHDRARFEVIGVSYGPDDRSDLRARIAAAFERFIDARQMSDREVARRLADLRVDIAVDLTGHTKGARPRILAFRPAPIQASYLGYPGTTGMDFIDYILADATVIPADRRQFYSERVVSLPDCYLPHDGKRTTAANAPSRQELGLPAEGFVFCCFNNSWKITPAFFDVWMRLLQAVPGSVLWLTRDSREAEANLRREAAARGVDSARLVFAPRLARTEDFLARQCAADLLLDTLPYNAHATASDALRSGLPVLTCRGESFSGRVAASLLAAIGLPELATHSLEEYERLALRLARDPSALRDIKGRLERNRATSPLFDTDRLRRHIEAAYRTMWEIWQRGERPRSFAVAP